MAVFTRVEHDGTPFVSMVIVDITDRLRAEADLRESEERYRSIVEQSFDGIQLVDTDSTIIEWNAAQERITGLASSAVLGRPCWDVWAKYFPREKRTSELRLRTETSTR